MRVYMFQPEDDDGYIVPSAEMLNELIAFQSDADSGGGVVYIDTLDMTEEEFDALPEGGRY